ncbi:hypothetical protein Efla_000042 [Eimeria flavescens]
MARIHTLADLASEDKQQQNASQGSRSGRSFLPFTTGEEPPSSFSVMECLFPKFSWKHSVFIFTLIDLIMYIVTVAYERSPGNPTSPSMSSLALFGASVPVDIRKGQLWRLVCPIFLHTGIFHLLVSCTHSRRLSSRILLELGYGTRRICVAYLVCGIVANLVSAAAFFCSVLKVGASTAIFGLIGIDLAELVVVWHSIEDRRPVVIQLALFAFLFVFFSVGSSTDVVGHLAGMAVGMSFGLAFNQTNPHASHNLGLFIWISYAVVGAMVVASAAAVWLIPRSCI